MKSKRHKKRGVALVLVLGSIAIMTVMLTEFQDEATGELITRDTGQPSTSEPWSRRQ